MTSEVVPIPLPWKRPYKGLMVAELGQATFRVERKEDGWTCGVQVEKKRMQVLARGLARQRDGQCRAEAFAATMPMEIKAKQSPTAEPGGPPTSGEPGSVARPAMGPRPGEENSGLAPPDPSAPDSSPTASSQVADGPASAVAFERVDDGCICGRMKGGTWVADPKGCVTLPRGASREDAEQIRSFAADYFARTASAAAATTPAGGDRLAKARAVRAAKAAAKHGAELPTNTRTGPSGAAKGRLDVNTAKKGAAKKGTAKKGTASKSTAKTGAGEPAKSSAKKDAPSKPSKGTAKKTGAGKGKDAPSKSGAKKAEANKGAAKKAGGPGATNKGAANKADGSKGSDVHKGAANKASASKGPDAPSKGPAKKASASKASASEQDPPPASGASPLQWHDVEGNPRANTPFGAFAIEPEADRHALYFYDLNGQSHFLGNRGDLRKLAEERAARGGVMPNMSRRSSELDAQLRGMIVNVGEDMR